MHFVTKLKAVYIFKLSTVPGYYIFFILYPTLVSVPVLNEKNILLLLFNVFYELTFRTYGLKNLSRIVLEFAISICGMPLENRLPLIKSTGTVPTRCSAHALPFGISHMLRMPQPLRSVLKT